MGILLKKRFEQLKRISEFKIYKDGTNELQQIYSKDFVMRNIPKKQREFRL